MNSVSKSCLRCGSQDLPHQYLPIPFCQPCRNFRREEQTKATAKVNKFLIFTGLIPKAKERICVDCGDKAHDYDHRDYTEPLNVVPVCRSCNILRGPAYDSHFRPGSELDAYMGKRIAKSQRVAA